MQNFAFVSKEESYFQQNSAAMTTEHLTHCFQNFFPFLTNLPYRDRPACTLPSFALFPKFRTHFLIALPEVF